MFDFALRRTFGTIASAGILIAALAVVSVGATGCSGGGDKATGPSGSSSASACSQASFDSSAAIGFNLGCNSVSFGISGITYDQFSRRTSYNYEMSCSDGTNRKVGRVYNITYNSIGQALTWDYTVNGTTCRKS